MRRLLICVLFLLPLRAELVDKLAIVVDHNVITELEVDEDIRLVALVNRRPVDRTLESRRAAADRLVQRLLIQHEIDVSRYPPPTKEEVEAYFSHVAASITGSSAFGTLLRTYDLMEPILRDYLASQLTMLRFIEYRFTPDVTVSEFDVEHAYQRELQAFRQEHPAGVPPPLDDSKRAELNHTLSEERTDAALDSWLAESRKQVTITYLDTALQ